MTDDNAPRWEYQARGLVIRPGTRWDQWEMLWSGVEQSHKSISFWVGDALLYGQAAFPDTWSQLIDAKYIEQQRGPMWVCSRIPIERRRESLSYSFHREIASLDPDAQILWLDRGEDRKWTVKDLKAAIEAEKRRSNGGPHIGEPPPIEPEPFHVEPPDDTFGDVKDIEGAEKAPQMPVQRDEAEGVSEIPPTPLRPSPGAAADEIREVIAYVRRMGANLSPDWRFGAVVDGATTSCRVTLTKGNQVAMGEGPSLPCALVEAALAALLSDLGDK